MIVSEKKKHRICIVSEQLEGGGAERCSAVLSQFFDVNNCEVHHVITIDKIEYEYAGKLLNLGKLKKGSYNLRDRIKRFKVLYQFFKTNSFDFIIDTRVVNRQFQELLIVKFIYNAPLIVMVHSYMLDLYFPKNQIFANIIYSKAKKIIAVSNTIKNKITSQYNYKQVETIYNPINIDFIMEQSEIKIEVHYKFILAVGNMNTNVKQFDQLISIYSKSILPNMGVKLLILGDGLLRYNLEQQAYNLNLKDKVIFKGRIKNPFPYYKLAFFTILTSKNEGFPTVLLESMACKTPVIAYNCLSGPSEIIHNNQNGILVENQNQEQMILAINEMSSNKNLYLHCKNNCLASVEKYSIQNIGNQWLQLFNSL